MGKTKQPAANLRSRLVKNLQDPWWQGAGALIGAVALGASVALGVAQASPSDEDERRTNNPPPSPVTTTSTTPWTESPPPSLSPSPSTTDPEPAQPDGNTNACVNGNGDNATNNCTFGTVKNNGSANLDMIDTAYAWFDGNVSDIPKPRTGDVKDYDCASWDDWMMATPSLYAVGPVYSMYLMGNASDRVMVTDVKLHTYKQVKLPQPGTVVKCTHLGGDVHYYSVSVSTSGKTTFEFSEDGQGSDKPPIPMPPGKMTLSSKGYTSAEIFLDTPANHLYEGSLEATVLINGTKRQITLGNRANPLRWVTPDFPTEGPTDFVGWNGTRARWERGYLPPSD
jgi:hypothetical protein